MQILEEKKNVLSILAFLFGIVSVIIAIVEFALIPIETLGGGSSILFFTSPGDAVFESAFLDHIMKAFVNLIIGAIFLAGIPKIQKSSIDGLSFLFVGGILTFGVGLVFISIWLANLIDTAIIAINETEVWLEFIITNGIRIEWFLGIGAISILYIWRNKEQYLN